MNSDKQWQMDQPHFIDGFLSRSTCEQIKEELQFCFWSPSRVLIHRNDNSYVDAESASRISKTAHSVLFTEKLKRIVHRIETRISHLISEPVERFEHWQATYYGPGGNFDYHFDSGNWHNSPAGDRKFTILIYLKSPLKGGKTHFRELDLEVAPTEGRLLIWKNLEDDGSRNLDMLHAGLPVIRGTKIALVTWAREMNIRNQPNPVLNDGGLNEI
jgi:prolyl 4-hydroxylase